MQTLNQGEQERMSSKKKSQKTESKLTTDQKQAIRRMKLRQAVHAALLSFWRRGDDAFRLILGLNIKTVIELEQEPGDPNCLGFVSVMFHDSDVTVPVYAMTAKCCKETVWCRDIQRHVTAIVIDFEHEVADMVDKIKTCVTDVISAILALRMADRCLRTA